MCELAGTVCGLSLRRREDVAELVDLNDVWDEAAASAKPDDAGREDKADGDRACRRDLPVAFAENKISVTLVPFLPCPFDRYCFPCRRLAAEVRARWPHRMSKLLAETRSETHSEHRVCGGAGPVQCVRA